MPVKREYTFNNSCCLVLFTEGTDYLRVNEVVGITAVHSQTIRTMFRQGFQPTTSFTVHLVPGGSIVNNTNNRINVQGNVTINILDESSRLLPPLN